MPLNTGSIGPLTLEGIRKLTGDGFRRYDLEFKEFFNVNQASKAVMFDYEVVGIGSLAPKGENNAITLTDPRVGRKKSYTMTVFAGGIRTSWEAEMDDLYGFIRRHMGSLGAAANETLNIEAARFFDKCDSGDSSPFTGFDALALLHDAHTDLDGSAFGSTIYSDNRIAATDLSESALATGLLFFDRVTDASGNHIRMDPRSLWYHPDQTFLVREILESEGKPYTADNTKNVLRGILTPKSWHFVTDNDRWLIQAAQHDANFFMRSAPAVDSYDDKATLSMVNTMVVRFGLGHGDFRGFVGSAGNP